MSFCASDSPQSLGPLGCCPRGQTWGGGVLGRDEEGRDGADAVLELLEGVYTVAKAVLDGDVGS